MSFSNLVFLVFLKRWSRSIILVFTSRVNQEQCLPLTFLLNSRARFLNMSTRVDLKNNDASFADLIFSIWPKFDSRISFGSCSGL